MVQILSGGSTSTGTFVFQDGDVDDVTIDTSSEIDAIPLWGTGSLGTILQDFNGVLKKINIRGSLKAATSTRVSGQPVSTIAAQKSWLEGLQDGLQSAHTFTSTYESGVTVMVEKMTFNEIAGEANHLPFTISLVVGSDTP